MQCKHLTFGSVKTVTSLKHLNWHCQHTTKNLDCSYSDTKQRNYLRCHIAICLVAEKQHRICEE